MRVLELEVTNVRGITDLTLKPDGKNLVVWGPNGSGKSAVVDALDFLLTGRISRLMGKGTGGITLSKHGPHVGHGPGEARVRAVVQLPGLAQPVEIMRLMDHPGTIQIQGATIDDLDPILILAARGQHVLTRREILKYVTAEAGTRAQEIQELMNIADVEEIRKSFVKVLNDLDRDLLASKRAVEAAQAGVNATIGENRYSVDKVLQAVSQSRAVLGGAPAGTIATADVKAGLRQPTAMAGLRTVNVTILDSDFQNLLGMPERAQIADLDRDLRSSLATVRADNELLHAISLKELTELGITIVDDSGKCPLCGVDWPPGELLKHLNNRLSSSQEAIDVHARIGRLSTTMAESGEAAVAALRPVIAATRDVGSAEQAQTLQAWQASLQTLSGVLRKPLTGYPDERFGAETVSRLLMTDGIRGILEAARSALRTKYPEVAPEQTAWDRLTRLEENLKSLEKAEIGHRAVELHRQRADKLLTTFQATRDRILGQLYQDVRDRFVLLYKQLHEIDEAHFTARLEPEGAGLNFEVDFYGRGSHPPHAFHSEGHQDSMGLCLYLALCEHLTTGFIDLVILDDVVMSVDAEHRRQVCRLLVEHFPTRQFIITTHDRTWASQLKSEGVVDSRGTVEFYNWTIEAGPQVNHEVDLWERIVDDLRKNDVPAASARLRRGLEQFFSTTCESLRAPVTFKLSGKWELGDLMPAALGQYRKLLKSAKKAAQSWGRSLDFDGLKVLEETAISIFLRAGIEQKDLNLNVHYNEWANFTAPDFQPVVEAFQDLCGIFVCQQCGAVIRLVLQDMTPSSLRCNCGAFNWNLIAKPGAVAGD